MMALQKEFQFNLVTMYSDGSPMDPATAAGMVYEINVTNMDTGTEETFAVPPAVVKAAVGGVVTALFTDLGFVPKIDTYYFAVMFDVVSGPPPAGISSLSNSILFAYGSPIIKPARPTNLWVSGGA